MEGLSIEAGWQVECWRCANNGFAAVDEETATLDDAQRLFREVGWRKTDDGYQMCPECWSEK